jgi:hypothetical protein
MHVHYEDWMPELYLSHGITTVRDVGNHTEWILAQRDGVKEEFLALGSSPQENY